MTRSAEEIRLATNLIRRGVELLQGVDERSLPGEPNSFRTEFRRITYEGANLVEGLEYASESLRGA